MPSPSPDNRLLLLAGARDAVGEAVASIAVAKGYRTAWVSAADVADYDTLLATVLCAKPVGGLFFASETAAMDGAEVWQHEFFNAVNFFRALERGHVFPCVYSSTDAVYGPINAQTLESDPLLPATALGQATLAVEALLHGLSMREEAGEDFYDTYRNHVMRVNMNYPDFNTPLFPCLRSFILRRFAGLGPTLAAEAHLLAFENVLNGGQNDVANLASVGTANISHITDRLAWRPQAA